MSKLQYSPVESARFGFEIFRAEADILLDLLCNLRDDVDIVIIRDRDAIIYPLYEQIRTCADTHFRDTIVSYRKRLTRGSLIAPTRFQCEIRPIVGTDWEFADALMNKVFQEYPGHYQRSPFFKRSDSAAGMCDWLRRLAEQPGNNVFSIVFEGGLVGFIGYAVKGTTYELALAATDPAVGVKRRNLVLLEAVRLAELLYLEKGMDFFVAKTQAANLSVQKNLVRYVHCEPAQSFSTLHIHFFLRHIRDHGNAVPVAGRFDTTVLDYARSIAGPDKVSSLTFATVPGGSVSKIKVVKVCKADGTGDALFFSGKNAADRITAHASVYLQP